MVGSLAFSANKNSDKVGAILFTDKIEKFIPLKKGRNHSLVILDNLLSFEPQGKKTDISKALDFLNKIAKRRAIVFLISDFIDKGYEKSMAVTAQKHDLIPIRIADRKYETLPKGAIFNMIDSETGEEIVIENLTKILHLMKISLKIYLIFILMRIILLLFLIFSREGGHYEKNTDCNFYDIIPYSFSKGY